MKVFSVLPILFLATSAVAASPTVGSDARHEMTAQARIPLAQAEVIALKVRPGTITDKELEKEAGGSGLRWSFDIAAQGKTYEVGVDAATGKVLENHVEGLNPD